MTLMLSSTVCDKIFDHFPLFDVTLRHIDKIFDHFPLFDVTLRHIELCNSV